MFVVSTSVLGDYEYVHNCLKIDADIRFVLCHRADVATPLLRTRDDDQQPVLVPKYRDHEAQELRVTRCVIIQLLGSVWLGVTLTLK